MFKEKNQFFSENIAAPSFIWPANIAENCIRLARLVPEVGLLFFETETCLNYTDEDLPPELANLGLRYHVHLPLDLPWPAGPGETWAKVSALVAKCAFLRPWAFVLHPPQDDICPGQENHVTNHHVSDCFKGFVDLWNRAGLDATLLVENIRGNDLLDAWPTIHTNGVGLCLDLGHLLAYRQETDRIPGVWPHVAMVHLSAPGPKGEHRSLRDLDSLGRARLEGILKQVRRDCVLVLEVFNFEDFQDSLTVLHEWGHEWKAASA